jgi:hypothetical protein
LEALTTKVAFKNFEDIFYKFISKKYDIFSINISTLFIYLFIYVLLLLLLLLLLFYIIILSSKELNRVSKVWGNKKNSGDFQTLNSHTFHINWFSKMIFHKLVMQMVKK